MFLGPSSSATAKLRCMVAVSFISSRKRRIARDPSKSTLEVVYRSGTASAETGATFDE